MERLPYGGEQWSGYRKQQLFQHLQTELVGYGAKRPLNDEYTGMPTTTLMHIIDAQDALKALWADAAKGPIGLPEIVYGASLSYAPAHTDAQSYPHPETVHLQIESGLIGGTVRVLQDYRIARTIDAVLGTHNTKVIPTSDASDFEDLRDTEEGRPQIMEAQQFSYVQSVLDELRYQRDSRL